MGKTGFWNRPFYGSKGRWKTFQRGSERALKMALKAVAARESGDHYQGLFFWREASKLLNANSLVEKVVFENDAVSGVDDVSVFYREPGVSSGREYITADYYQIKYHIDQKDSYSSSAFIDPAFTGTKESLLKKFFAAYLRLSQKNKAFRLLFASNWDWKEDALAPLLREDEGALPEQFFTATPGSAVGKVRESWRIHLGANDKEFVGFAKKLRLKANLFGRRDFHEWVYDKLALAGLKTPSADRIVCPYDALYRFLIRNQQNEFTKETLLELCRKEGLLANSTTQGRTNVLGVRSFLRFAEQMEDETDSFVCVAKHFDGRYIRNGSSWNSNVANDIKAFFNGAALRRALRSEPHKILLDCHLSLAFLAGYELDRKSGVNVVPVQKGVATTIWHPSGEAKPEWKWGEVSTRDIHKSGSEIAIAVSITRDVMSSVLDSINALNILARRVLHFVPKQGIGLLEGPDHALALADSLVSSIREMRKEHSGAIHIFVSSPNAFMFFLGQHRNALGQLQLYEFDFEGARGGLYVPSISL